MMRLVREVPNLALIIAKSQSVVGCSEHGRFDGEDHRFSAKISAMDDFRPLRMPATPVCRRHMPRGSPFPAGCGEIIKGRGEG